MKEESGGSVTVFSPAAEEARISTKYIREWIGRYGGGGEGGGGGESWQPGEVCSRDGRSAGLKGD